MTEKRKPRNGLFVEYCAKDILDGTLLLDPWVELAYRRLIDMIYATNDNLPDDDKSLAWSTKVGTRWKAIRATLITAEKIQIIDGRISNERCRFELQKSARKIAQHRGAGEASAATRKSLKNLKRPGTADATAAGTGARTNYLTTELKEEREEPTADAVVKKPATRLPDDFVMPEEWITAAVAIRAEKKLAPADLRTEAMKFTNYWIARGGQQAAKRDWHRTWINWALEAKGVYRNGHSQGRSAADGIAAGFADALSERNDDRGDDLDPAEPLRLGRDAPGAPPRSGE
jgi:uncharacterized protein YdaU (DUF1376 family)